MYRDILLLCFLGVSQALLECPQDFCSRVDCADVRAEDCNGYVKPKGGFCGCCDVCITVIQEGGHCLGMFLMGVPATSECGDGLYCDPNTHTCKQAPAKRDIVSCSTKLAEVNQQLGAHNGMLMGLEKPRCDENGDYLGMQYAGSMAYCVTKDGVDLSSMGYSVHRWETGPDMNCQCARDLYDYMQSGLIGKLFYCDPNGNYPATPAPSKRQDAATVGPCQQQLDSVTAQLASHMLLGLEKPHCDANGYYEGMQFAGSQAYCVTKDGTSLSYMVNRWETGDHMDCQCARDQYDYQQTGMLGRMFNCLPNGNYAPIQCMGSVCYCVDSMGKQIGTSTVPIYQQDSLNC